MGDRGRSAAGSLWSRVGGLGYTSIGFVLLLGLWWAGIHLFADPDGFLVRFAPEDAFAALARLIAGDEIFEHAGASLKRIVVGLLIATGVGVPLGLALGASPMLSRTTGASLQFIRMISPLSWTPLAIVLFGVGDAPIYFLIAVGAVWPVVLNTSAGLAKLDRGWLTVGRSLGATRWELLRRIVWPGIRSDLVTGMRLAVGLAWIIIVPAEMLGVDSGLGYFILDTRDRFAYGELVAAILVIGVIGALIDLLARGALATGT